MFIDPPAQQPIAPPSDWERVLRSVLVDVVTVNMVKPLVETEVKRQGEFWDLKISGIDTDQRNSWREFRETTQEIRNSFESIRQAMTQVSTQIASLTTNDQGHEDKLKKIEERIERLESKAVAADSRMQGIEAVQVDLHTDIHGGSDDGLRPSIHSMFKSLDAKLDSKFTTIEGSIQEIKATQQRHDAYISRQQMVINVIWKQAKTLWSNRLWRYSLITFAATSGAVLLANTPGGLAVLNEIVKALASGK